MISWCWVLIVSVSSSLTLEIIRRELNNRNKLRGSLKGWLMKNSEQKLSKKFKQENEINRKAKKKEKKNT